MKILLLGATGRTGKLVLKRALADGFEVHCLARNSNRIKPQQKLTVIEGDANDIQDLQKALNGCDAIISVLNISRTSDFPWAPLKTPKTYLSDVMHKLTTIAQQESINKIVICSAWGVAETNKDLPFWFRWLIKYSNIGFAYKDHEKQEKILYSSELNWTIVRPVGLTNSSQKASIQESWNNQPKPNLLVSRDSVARYLINSITRTDLNHKTVVVS
ncbi:NAD(P)-dependent oxidoreductase [Flavobacterium sp. ASW18X]|uniref:NAD(P)-dependent oxidoreductase n=1 Tax=Flavobacterium sp. ASW18X TaxID=2572595 RepID=UPI0010AE8C7C|nr:NAD(P)H-binding protein [Flavobacterium sp. ASW18X]TKD65356.1 NAD-dependent epimerase/dehydratase family protein [Flavobacterium sp. ASW18X]